MFEASEVLRVLRLLAESGCEVWIAGGWGIDALVGRATREHRDLDLVHRAEQEPRLVEALESAGFAERPGVVPGRPARFVMHDHDGHELDLHPLHFGADGSAVLRLDAHGGTVRYPADCFVTGTIESVPVPCVSIAQQVVLHQGYEPGDRDRHDMAELERLAHGSALSDS